jgi:hypothetical protein
VVCCALHAACAWWSRCRGRCPDNT